MALGRTLTVAVRGTQGHLVEVEAGITSGLPAFTVVGLPDSSVNECRDRVRAAIANAGYVVPQARIAVTLSPAVLSNAGTSSDLAIGVALLAGTGIIPTDTVRRFVHIGELGLDGRVRAVRGVFAAALAAVRAGRPDVVVAAENAPEAALVPGARVWPVHHLREVVVVHGGEPSTLDLDDDDLAPVSGADAVPASPPRRAGREPDLADIIGQAEGRRALEVAAAGGHHLLMIAPPGAGMSMLAARLPGLLPDLDDEQQLDVTAVHSVAGTWDPGTGLIRRPPFESPHHTATLLSLVGGGSGLARPGAASLAHRGILFLDEATEFATGTLEALRPGLDDGEILLHRRDEALRFPARFQLVLATHPCPCGYFQGTGQDCACAPATRRRYLSRLPGHILDRVDLQVTLPAVTRAKLATAQPGENTATVAARVAAARLLQRERLANTRWVCNSEVSGEWLTGPLRLPPAVTHDADQARDQGHLSTRGHHQVLRVAWTLSDLAGRTTPQRDDIAHALHLRQPGQASA